MEVRPARLARPSRPARLAHPARPVNLALQPDSMEVRPARLARPARPVNLALQPDSMEVRPARPVRLDHSRGHHRGRPGAPNRAAVLLGRQRSAAPAGDKGPPTRDSLRDRNVYICT